MSKTVPVTLPDRVWGRLASIADVRGEKVGDLIAEAVLHIVEGTRPTEAKPLPRVWAESSPLGKLAELDRELKAARASGWRPSRYGTKGTAA